MVPKARFVAQPEKSTLGVGGRWDDVQRAALKRVGAIALALQQCKRGLKARLPDVMPMVRIA